MANEVSDAELAELERLEAAATEAPWYASGRHVGLNEPGFAGVGATLPTQHLGVFSDRGDAALACAARNALSGLLARLRAAEERCRSYEQAWDEHLCVEGAHHAADERMAALERSYAITLEALTEFETKWKGEHANQDAAYARGRADERVAVAAWLSRPGRWQMFCPEDELVFHVTSSVSEPDYVCIERGDHLTVAGGVK